MSGAIMPLPLAMPVIRIGASPIHAVRVAALGKVSVVMMPRAAASPGIVAQARMQRRQRRDQLVVRQHLADHAGGGDEHLLRRAADQLRRRRRGRGAGIAPGLAGEHVGVAGVHHDGARLAAGERGAAPVHRRARALAGGEHARRPSCRRPVPASPGRCVPDSGCRPPTAPRRTPAIGDNSGNGTASGETSWPWTFPRDD